MTHAEEMLIIVLFKERGRIGFDGDREAWVAYRGPRARKTGGTKDKRRRLCVRPSRIDG